MKIYDKIMTKWENCPLLQLYLGVDNGQIRINENKNTGNENLFF
jgi:hypothetical protein